MTAQPITEAAPLRVALYARISKDAVGQRLGVEDQLARGREYAAAKGFQVVAEADDNDISAFRGKHRPGYERLRSLVRSGQVDALVVPHASRLTRNREERASIIREFGDLGVDVHETYGMVYPMGTSTGRMLFDQMGAAATHESDLKTERVKAAVDRRTNVGRHTSHPGYGWRSTGATPAQRGYELHPEQADLIRRLAKAVAGGASLRALARQMNDEREPVPGAFKTDGTVPKRYWTKEQQERHEQDPTTPAPTEYGPLTKPAPRWGAMTIRQLLVRPSNIGELHLRKSNETMPGAWPAILTDALYRQVVARLDSAKGKGKKAPRPTKRTHLLTMGVAYCGECGGTMTVANRKIPKKDGTVRINVAYRCSGTDLPDGTRKNGCTQRRVDHLDDFARDALVARLSRRDSLAWLAGDDGEAAAATEEAADLARRMDEAADAYADGAISLAQLTAINAKVQPQLDAAKNRQRAAARHLDLPLLEKLAGPKAREEWDAMDVAQRRLALEAVGMRIDIGKSRPTGRPLTELDQDTVTLTFGG